MKILYTQQRDLSLDHPNQILDISAPGQYGLAMLVRTRLGAPFRYIPARMEALPVWSFIGCLAGRAALGLADKKDDGGLRQRTLWVLPPMCAHGWVAASARAERVVFDFTEVPLELKRLLPGRGYYRIALSLDDCRRLRVLAESTLAMTARPTELIGLHNRHVLTELSLMALREVTPRALVAPERARIKTEEALAWYDRHIAEDPGIGEIARAVLISPAHLRRLFHRAHGQSPHVLLNRRRMQRVEALLRDTPLGLVAIAAQVGFSDDTALSRATKTHFGYSPREIRKRGRGG
jgi:AraC family transcriptional regulator